MKIKQFILSFGLLFAIVSCQPTQETQLLSQKWRVVFNTQQLLNGMSDQEKAFYEKIPAEKQKQTLNQLVSLANKNSFEFKADNTYELLLQEKEITESGKWSLEKINSRSIIKLLRDSPDEASAPDLSEELIIKTLNKDSLLVSVKNQEGQEKEYLLKAISK
ncbi:MAG: hypothetical protein AAFU64_03765 [Bacteroidota bacterium]